MGVTGPYLVAAPLSTLPNWIEEFTRFSNKIPCYVYHGTPDSRADVRTKILQQTSAAGHMTCPVIITSYEVIIRDKKYLSVYPWKFLIVDEGHRLKNFNCRLVRELKNYKTDN